ncbi:MULTISPECIES: DUF5590 domain-containing protein [unclassified Granulicatella]|uniref:cell wall elongation regulator TseB-like domain-containing protein n=1 Tax=unclassified Granulicatella TaxID=2630493 RepID=UPI00107341F8|nr:MULTISPECIES: DUF5590 domain-containing protein [unclassified Granulicatella]MBF0780659.1 DUF5590 domain-containing protein [Granulicatella sp. 19428wC4_WM01]TFU94559.1 hypothetical protein E4T68_06075 [Granulicatella sp. WM01]
MKKILWSILASSIIIGISVLVIFNRAISPYEKQKHAISHLVISEGILKHVERFYLYQADQKVLSVLGKNSSGEHIYVITEENNTAHLYYKREFITEEQAVQVVQSIDNDSKILHTVLGWYKQQPVWEIAYVINKYQLCYMTISAYDGKIIRHIKST